MRNVNVEVVDFAAAEIYSESVARNTVPEVIIVRLSVWFSAWFMISRNEPRTPSLRSSRMRSKMTIVSLMEKPMTSIWRPQWWRSPASGQEIDAKRHEHVVDDGDHGADGE